MLAQGKCVHDPLNNEEAFFQNSLVILKCPHQKYQKVLNNNMDSYISIRFKSSELLENIEEIFTRYHGQYSNIQSHTGVLPVAKGVQTKLYYTTDIVCVTDYT